jgi:hypothetical protein
VILPKGLTNRNDLPPLDLVETQTLENNQISNPIISLIVKAKSTGRNPTEMVFHYRI